MFFTLACDSAREIKNGQAAFSVIFVKLKLKNFKTVWLKMGLSKSNTFQTVLMAKNTIKMGEGAGHNSLLKHMTCTELSDS
jgi:hypothetical protein